MGLIWRLLLILGGITFLVNGAAILSDENCKYVDLGGTHRVISYTCLGNEVNAYNRLAAPDDADLSGGAAGGLGLAIGSGMILLAIWPVIQRFSENQESDLGSSRYRSFTPTPKPPSSTQTTTLPSSPRPQTEVEGSACSNCDATVSESAKFCPECGEPIEDPSCPKCGAEPSEGAAFCDQCGTNLKAEA